LDMQRVQNWLDHFKLEYHKAHASGHACREDLLEAINEINPKSLIPVHTEHPEEFSKLGRNLILPKQNVQLELIQEVTK